MLVRGIFFAHKGDNGFYLFLERGMQALCFIVPPLLLFMVVFRF